jgi:hypothetical protein
VARPETGIGNSGIDASPSNGENTKGLGQGQQGPNIGVQIQNMHVQNGDGEAVARDINRNVAQYPFETR